MTPDAESAVAWPGDVFGYRSESTDSIRSCPLADNAVTPE